MNIRIKYCDLLFNMYNMFAFVVLPIFITNIGVRSVFLVTVFDGVTLTPGELLNEFTDGI